MSKKVYICSPYRGENVAEVKKHIAMAQRACRMAFDFGFIPVAPHLYFPQFADDAIPSEHLKAMVMGLSLLLECEQVWAFGEASEGMKKEIELAKEKKIPVYYKELKNGQTD